MNKFEEAKELLITTQDYESYKEYLNLCSDEIYEEAVLRYMYRLSTEQMKWFEKNAAKIDSGGIKLPCLFDFLPKTHWKPQGWRMQR